MRKIKSTIDDGIGYIFKHVEVWLWKARYFTFLIAGKHINITIEGVDRKYKNINTYLVDFSLCLNHVKYENDYGITFLFGLINYRICIILTTNNTDYPTWMRTEYGDEKEKPQSA